MKKYKIRLLRDDDYNEQEGESDMDALFIFMHRFIAGCNHSTFVCIKAGQTEELYFVEDRNKFTLLGRFRPNPNLFPLTYAEDSKKDDESIDKTHPYGELMLSFPCNDLHCIEVRRTWKQDAWMCEVYSCVPENRILLASFPENSWELIRYLNTKIGT